MHPSGEVGRFQMDNLSSPPGDRYRSAKLQNSKPVSTKLLMSTRTSIFANSKSGPKEIAEGMYGVPLLWLPLLSVADIESTLEAGELVVDRKIGISRLSDAISFVSAQFPDIENMNSLADTFITHLLKCNADTISIDVGEPIEMNPKRFPKLFAAVISAIESRNHKYKDRSCKTLRDALCVLSTLDPDNGIVETEQIIGDLW